MTEPTSDAEARVLFRIAKTNPPTNADFMSGKARGKQLLDSGEEKRRLWEGISVYATEAQARRTARKYPRIGTHIAALRVPGQGPIKWERTTGQPGHYTLWGDPEDLARCIVSVVRVE